MSQATLEQKTSVDAGSDLASLVIAYHRQHHGDWTDVDPALCEHTMCRVADEVVGLDALLLGTDA